MNFLIAILLSFAFSVGLSKQIKKHAGIFYLLAVFISLGVSYVMPMVRPNTFLWYAILLFQRGAVATALFTIVMYMAVLKNGSTLKKRLFAIRAEISIIACIITLCHNFIYGKTYMVALFKSPDRLDSYSLSATVLTIVLDILMLPLMVTSFECIRRKMKAKSWKKLQRLAYLFYMLIYVHVMILFAARAKMGITSYYIDMAIYSAVFGSYAVLRVRKYVLSKNKR